ncbi:MAG: hypothetical protein ACK6DY_22660 [Acidobacteriota bacterium]
MFSALAAAVWTIETLLALPALGDPQIRPDGAAYAYVLNGQVHRAALPAGPPVAVAAGSRPRWSPNGKLLAYLANGKIRLGKHSYGAAVNAYSWSPDGKAFAYLATDNPPPVDPIVNRDTSRYTGLFLQPLSGAPPRRLTGPTRHVLSYALSPNGKRAAIAVQRTPKPEDIFHVDILEI